MRYRIIDDPWKSSPFSFTNDEGKQITLVSYFCDVMKDEEGNQALEKVYFNQKPDTKAPEKGDTLEGDITEKTNKKGTHHKFKKSQAFIVVCPACKNQFDAKAHKADTRSSVSPVNSSEAVKDISGDKTSQNASQSLTEASQSKPQATPAEEPPIEAYDDVPF